MRHRWRPVVLGIMFVLGGVGLWCGALRPPAASALPYLGQAPAFTLTDEHDRAFTATTLGGRIWVAAFIFTRCPDQCLLMTDHYVRLSQRLGSDDHVRLVSFSVDPVHDTPPVLRQYAGRFPIPDDRWILLTGDAAQIRRVAEQGFRLASGSGEAVGSGPMTHSVRLVLVDGRGHIRGYYDGTDAAAVGRLLEDIRRLRL